MDIVVNAKEAQVCRDRGKIPFPRPDGIAPLEQACYAPENGAGMEKNMRVVLQRVQEASVAIDGKVEGKIGKGLLALLGVGQEDTQEIAEKYLDKICKLRIFEDQEGKTNLSLEDVKGELLVVSQFTLYADCRKGNRPSFIQAAPPELGRKIYEYFLEISGQRLGSVEHGEFGANMQVSLVNDGPFTVVLDDDTVLRKGNKQLLR